MRKLTLILPALVLAGCSTPTESTPAPVVEETFTPPPVETYSTDEPFGFVADSTIGEIQFRGGTAPGFLEYQAAVGNTDPFSFATVDVDNRNGTGPVDSIGALAYTEAGEQHECTHVNNALNDHIPEEPVTDEAITLYNNLDGVYDVSAGERATVHLVCAGETPTEVTAATFRTGGMEFPGFSMIGQSEDGKG